MANDNFPETHWSAILRIQNADAADRQAWLNEFLTVYRPALMSFLVRKMRIAEDLADDLVQGFICEKILASDNVLGLANQRGRFRNVLRRCLKNFAIDHFRKRKLEPAASAELEKLLGLAEEAAMGEALEESTDQAWGRAVFQQILEEMKQTSEYWTLFEARMLTSPPTPYAELLDRFGFRSPDEASNRLMTAKRQFNRIVERVLWEHHLEGAGAEEARQQELQLLQSLAGQPDVVRETLELLRPDASSESYSVGVRMGSMNVLDERQNELSDDLAGVMQHLLQLDIANYLEEQGASTTDMPGQAGESPGAFFAAEESTRGRSFGDVLLGCDAPFEVLYRLKEHFNVRARSRDCLPSKVNVAMYFLHIAACVKRFPERTGEMTTMGEEKMREGLTRLSTQDWIPQEFRDLLQAALEGLSA